MGTPDFADQLARTGCSFVEAAGVDLESLGQDRQVAVAGDEIEAWLDAQGGNAGPAQCLVAGGEARDAADGVAQL